MFTNNLAQTKFKPQKSSKPEVKSNMYAYDRINYDKILRSYMDKKGIKDLGVVYINKQDQPSQYFNHKEAKKKESLGVKLPKSLVKDISFHSGSRNNTSFDNENDLDTSRRLIDSFRLVPNKSNSPKVKVISTISNFTNVTSSLIIDETSRL